MDAENHVSIFEMAELEYSALEQRIQETLELHPVLREIFDADFVTYVSKRRADLGNFLLVLLINPRSPTTEAFWDEVSVDVESLRPEQSLGHFTPKFRQLERVSVESAKTELELAAWAKRHLGSVVLEPSAPETTRLCDFTAVMPELTWWEIKSILDIASVRQQDQLQLRIQAALRTIPEPFVLSLRKCDTRPNELDAALQDIRRQFRDLNSASELTLPVRVESNGLVVEVAARTGLDHGYLGTLQSGFIFGGENITRVRECIEVARHQLPAGGPGIAVVDRTATTWIHDHDVLEACFGEEKMVVQGGRPYRGRDSGVFRKGANTRISAVMSIERWNDGQLKRQISIYHNPYAAKAISPDAFGRVAVTQWGSKKERDGNFWPVKLNSGREGSG